MAEIRHWGQVGVPREPQQQSQIGQGLKDENPIYSPSSSTFHFLWAQNHSSGLWGRQGVKAVQVQSLLKLTKPSLGAATFHTALQPGWEGPTSSHPGGSREEVSFLT